MQFFLEVLKKVRKFILTEAGLCLLPLEDVPYMPLQVSEFK